MNGCTGDAYLKRTGTEFEKNPALVISRIKTSINSRYAFLGYLQFHRLIEDILKKVPRGLEGEAKKAAERPRESSSSIADLLNPVLYRLPSL